jgi:hypothetical protein
MPVRAAVGDREMQLLHPAAAWRTLPGAAAPTDSLKVDPDFYVKTARAGKPAP